ncbi:dipeptide ABC transporter ATP-binding protein [Stella sp.]|uniref:dipeptide ABC transporter ATP-binding protein n=1 Tax=Stella sp. TaxID=2912054 RepID=UPI0035AF4B22
MTASAGARPVLEVEDLAVRFGDGPPAVGGVSFALAAGEALGIVGESGSGKSATMLAIAGLLPRSARIEGRLRLGATDLVGLDERGWRPLRGRRVAIVFQEAMAALNPLMTAGSQIIEAIRAHAPDPAAAARERALGLLAEVGLPDPDRVAASRPWQLSGGQQQRVLIAMALACDPELLIADEPTTALDTTVQAQILALLHDLRRRRRMALLFVSHDLGVVAAVADRVLVMQGGRVVESGPVARLFQAPEHPYTRRLVARHAPSVRPDPPAAAAPPAIAAEGLSVRYARPGGGHHAALDGVSFALAPGRVLGIVGESGSGKSTLARALVGLVRPSAGQVRVFGRDPAAGGDRRAFARRCQMVFQDSGGSLNPRLPVARLLAEPFRIHGLCPTADIRARSLALLAEVGLPADLMDRHPHRISGGQRQRVAIARALAVAPDLLVCDEILSALDAATQAQVLDLIAAIARARGLTIVFVSHDLEVVAGIADEVLVLHHGRVVEHGPVRQVLTAPADAHTAALVAAMPGRPGAAAPRVA